MSGPIIVLRWATGEQQTFPSLKAWQKDAKQRRRRERHLFQQAVEKRKTKKESAKS
jgi:hypothetical protein